MKKKFSILLVVVFALTATMMMVSQVKAASIVIHDDPNYAVVKPKAECLETINAADGALWGRCKTQPLGNVWLLRWPATEPAGRVTVSSTILCTTVYIQFHSSDKNDGVADIYVDDMVNPIVRIDTYMRSHWYVEIGGLSNSLHNVRVRASTNAYFGDVIVSPHHDTPDIANDGDLDVWYFGFGDRPTYTLTITANYGGTTEPAPGIHSYLADSLVEVTAIPEPNYALDYWEVDGNDMYPVNPCPVLMDSNHTVHTVFFRAKATFPSPANGAKEVATDVMLTWLPGDHAASHDVYLGTSFDDVNDANNLWPVASGPNDPNVYKGNQDADTYDPCGLGLGTTYYWRVDGVNDVNIWKGSVWSFTVAGYFVVDDFEDYNDLTNPIQDTWTESGSAGMSLSTDPGPHHWGNQSMEVFYDDALGAAEVSRTPDDPNWTTGSMKALSIWYKGDPTVDELYIKLGDGTSTSIQVISDVNVQSADWQDLLLELSEFIDVSLKSVSEISIGITPAAGGSGAIYIDDIRLHPSRCLDPPAGDLNDDCMVDFRDIAILGSSWLKTGMWP